MNTSTETIFQVLELVKSGETTRRSSLSVGEFFCSVKPVRLICFGSTRFEKSPWPVVFSEDSEIDEILYIDCLDHSKYKMREDTSKANCSRFYEEDNQNRKAPAERDTLNKIKAKTGFGACGKQDSPQVVCTPQALFDKLKNFFHFDYDPCPVLPLYDAMISSWGQSNFVNPPFKYTDAFCFRACDLTKTTSAISVLLIPVPFKNCWFSNIVRSGCLKMVYLIRAVIFEGYSKRMPLDMCLLVIGPNGVSRTGQVLNGLGTFHIPLRFYDYEPPIKFIQSTCPEKKVLGRT